MSSSTDVNDLYAWEGWIPDGQLLNGTIYARNKLLAQAQLIQEGIQVHRIRKIYHSSFTIQRYLSRFLRVWKNRNPIKRMDIILFSQQIALLLEAGLSLTQSLTILESTSPKPKLHHLIVEIRRTLEEGMTLKESLQQHPKHFDRLYSGLIHMGEKTGTMIETFKQIIAYQYTREKIKQDLKKALSYPLTVLIMAVVITVALLMFVFPQFTAFFNAFNADLPYLTQCLLRISYILRQYGLYVFFLALIFLSSMRWSYKKHQTLREQFDQYIVRIPFLGSFLKQMITAHFTRTLAATLNAGLPMIEALEITHGSLRNHHYARAIEALVDKIATGQSLSQAIKATMLFSKTVDQMIDIGEESGKLCEMLFHIANYYETKIQQRILTFNTFFEPAIMILLGILIGSLILALYLPIFKLSSLF